MPVALPFVTNRARSGTGYVPELIPGRVRSEAMPPLVRAVPGRFYASRSFGGQVAAAPRPAGGGAA